jgi:hypothetical protein
MEIFFEREDVSIYEVLADDMERGFEANQKILENGSHIQCKEEFNFVDLLAIGTMPTFNLFPMQRLYFPIHIFPHYKCNLWQL